MLDAASLALQAVKAVYDIWKKEMVASLALTNEAKRVLKMMQSDETGNGRFSDGTGFGTSKLILVNVSSGEEITTTRRVITELEAKGIVKIADEVDEEKFELTHFGWILNPDTGQVDKIG